MLQNIDFALPPGAVVTGRVVDETGEAVAHVSVSLSRRRYIDGARRLVAESGSSTDDRGEFRIFGVPPGDYVIVARFDATDLGSRDRVRYVPTYYYPGTPVASEAQRVTVGPGQEVLNRHGLGKHSLACSGAGIDRDVRQQSGPR